MTLRNSKLSFAFFALISLVLMPLVSGPVNLRSADLQDHFSKLKATVSVQIEETQKEHSQGLVKLPLNRTGKSRIANFHQILRPHSQGQASLSLFLLSKRSKGPRSPPVFQA